MSPPALLVGLLVAGAVLSGWPSVPRPSGLPGVARKAASADRQPAGPDPPGQPGVARLAGAAATALGAGTFLGGEVGLVAGALAGALAWLWLGRLEPATVRRRRERLEADLPHAVDLLAACLVGGHAPGPAVEQVRRAVGGPVGEELALVSARLRLGVDPTTVWRGLGHHPQLGALGRCVTRATVSGASVAAAMDRLAEDLRREARARVESQARAVGVRAALPLGVCLLPAFVLMGVVPLVAGSVGALLGRDEAGSGPQHAAGPGRPQARRSVQRTAADLARVVATTHIDPPGSGQGGTGGLMTSSPVARLRKEQGVASAEYAVATAAGCGFAAVLIKLLTSDWGQGLLKTLFDLVLKMIGL